jgi:hypothetical protein
VEPARFVKVGLTLTGPEAELSPVVAALVKAGRRQYHRDAPTLGMSQGSNMGGLGGPDRF